MAPFADLSSLTYTATVPAGALDPTVTDATAEDTDILIPPVPIP